MIVEILLTVAQVVVFLYDVVTYPVYKAIERLQAKQEEKDTSTPRWVTNQNTVLVSRDHNPELWLANITTIQENTGCCQESQTGG